VSIIWQTVVAIKLDVCLVLCNKSFICHSITSIYVTCSRPVILLSYSVCVLLGLVSAYKAGCLLEGLSCEHTPVLQLSNVITRNSFYNFTSVFPDKAFVSYMCVKVICL